MNKNSESFNIARHQYIKGYQDKKEHIFPTLDLVAKEFSLTLSTLRKKAANEGWYKKRKQYQEIVDTYQGNVNGDVKLKLFKGNVIILGRKSENSLYDLSKVSFENNEQKDQQFAEEFIKSQFRKIN